MGGAIFWIFLAIGVFFYSSSKNKKGGKGTQSNTQTSQNPNPSQATPTARPTATPMQRNAPTQRPTVTPMQRPTPNTGRSPVPGREENKPKYYDSTCMDANSRHDHDRRLEQLQGFLKDGIIDKEEYRILLYKYQQRQ